MVGRWRGLNWFFSQHLLCGRPYSQHPTCNTLLNLYNIPMRWYYCCCPSHEEQVDEWTRPRSHKKLLTESETDLDLSSSGVEMLFVLTCFSSDSDVSSGGLFIYCILSFLLHLFIKWLLSRSILTTSVYTYIINTYT